MSDEKHIEELANDIEVVYRFGRIDFNRTAQILHRKGYRKQRELRRWQFEDRGGKKTKRPVCSGCGASPAYYLRKSKTAPPYCHECGAPMSEEVAE